MCSYVEYREDGEFIAYNFNFKLSFKLRGLNLIVKE